jgi:hypothetical protein
MIKNILDVEHLLTGYKYALNLILKHDFFVYTLFLAVLENIKSAETNSM